MILKSNEDLLLDFHLFICLKSHNFVSYKTASHNIMAPYK